MVQVARYGGAHAASRGQGVEVHLTFEKRVAGVDVGVDATVMDGGHGGHVVEVVVAILERIDAGLGLQAHLGGEDVGTLALGGDVTREGVEAHLGKEILQG